MTNINLNKYVIRDSIPILTSLAHHFKPSNDRMPKIGKEKGYTRNTVGFVKNENPTSHIGCRVGLLVS